MTAPTLTPAPPVTCAECARTDHPDTPDHERAVIVPLVDQHGSWTVCWSCVITLLADMQAGGDRFTLVFDGAVAGDR